MDWIRRNWPDLLIGVALVAVIAGIVITLLSGGSFSLFNRQSRVATNPVTPTSTTSPFNNTANNAATTTPATTTPATQLPAGTTTAITTADATTVVTTQDPAAVVVTTPDATTPNATTTGGIEPILPDLPVAAPAGTADTTVVVTEPIPTSPESTAAVAPTPAPTVTASTPIPTAAADRSAPYRVSVGAFGQRQNAEELASTFRAQGYPVFVAPENNLFITLVGPYTQEADAVQVANRIRAAGNDALVYRLPEPQPEAPAPVVAASTPAPSPAPAPAPEPVATAVTPAPVETPAVAPEPVATTTDPNWVNRGAGTLLQVGAYGSLESSLPQRRRLESLGFTVSERFADGLIRLVIGPFDERELSVVQAQLAVNGIDNFPVP